MLEGREKDEFLLVWDAKCLVVGVGVGHDRWSGKRERKRGDAGGFLSLSVLKTHRKKLAQTT